MTSRHAHVVSRARAVRHLARAVGETVSVHRVSDRAARRARAQGAWAA